MRKLFLTGLISAVLASTSVFGDDETTGSRADDAAITARVKAALIRDDSAKARQIDVETKGGVVQLSGFVESHDVIEAAVKTAAALEGVEEVRNDLVVRDTDRTAGQTVDDTVIAAKVKTQLAEDTDLSTATDINVEVNNGVVQLSGFVASVDAKTRAADSASRVDGVRDVRNNLALEP
jgi:hyperosmotically inducible protein